MGYLLAYVDQLGEGDYSPETWSNLQTGLTYSQGVYDNPDATQRMITLATNRIQRALDEMDYIDRVLA